MPASVKYLAVIIVALVASTLIFSMMLPTGGCRASSSITQAEMKDIDQLCREANAMAKHDEFLRQSVPSLSRVGNHRRSCRSAQGGNCSCNWGSYTFSDVADLEAQLLKPGNKNGVSGAPIRVNLNADASAVGMKIRGVPGVPQLASRSRPCSSCVPLAPGP